MRRLAALALLLLAATPALAQYDDPWGLPSGTDSLRIARRDSILSGAAVQGFDFTGASVDSLLSYEELVAAGVADLVFVEMLAGESEHWLRAPEDPVYELDRYTIADLGEAELAEVGAMPDPDTLERFVTAVVGHAYALLQLDAAAAPESTAVKLRVVALTDSTVTFDWVWQPNGEMVFVPSAAEERSLGAIKALY